MDEERSIEGGRPVTGASTADRDPLPDHETFLRGDVEIFRAGAGQFLVHSAASGEAGFHRSEVVALLASCDTFRSLAEHVDHYVSTQHPVTHPNTLRRELERLAQGGYLLSAASLVDQPVTDDGQVDRITTIGYPTRDRVSRLERGVASYAEHCHRYDRSVTHVVADDSERAETRDQYRRVLGSLARRTGVDVVYAGREEKRTFLDALIEVGHLDPDVVEFAVFGDEHPGASTIGGNRNALLLRTVGELVLSADDDTRCQISEVPDRVGRAALDDGGAQLHLWFFSDRESAFGAAAPAQVNLLDRHEQFLGSSPPQLLRALGREAGVELAGASPGVLGRLQSPAARVALTSNGTVGDCGWDNPDFSLFQDGATKQRMSSSAESYRLARRSRDMIQSVDRVTLEVGANLRFAMCFGLDNRTLVPPFPPVGRAEDVGFSTVFSRAFPDVLSVQLPWLVQHDPEGLRAFVDRNVFSLDLGLFLGAVSADVDLSVFVSPPERLADLGRRYQALGSLTTASFGALVRHLVWQSLDAMVGQLEADLEQGPPPAPWVQDVRRYLARARRQSVAEVDEICAPAGGQARLQRIVIQFGELVQCWPQIVDAARDLRSAEVRLGGPLT